MLLEKPPTTVAAVSMWLPPFCPDNPRIWFVQVEAQFSWRGIIASRMKCEEIVCALPTKYATKVQHLLIDSPEDDPYEKFKDQLTLWIADSKHQKIRQLLTTKQIGDCKPTQLLRKMRQLLGGKAPFDSLLLCKLFLQQLPSNVQMILASADKMSIDKLAEMADRIMNMATAIVPAVSTSTGDDSIWRLFREEVNTAQQTQ